MTYCTFLEGEQADNYKERKKIEKLDNDFYNFNNASRRDESRDKKKWTCQSYGWTSCS